jgi:hypothetical protein
MIIRLDLWENLEKNNTDSYGKACIDVARELMKILDTIPKNLICNPHDFILQAQENVNVNISGAMTCIVVQIIRDVHSRGFEFAQTWNFHYPSFAVELRNFKE